MRALWGVALRAGIAAMQYCSPLALGVLCCLMVLAGCAEDNPGRMPLDGAVGRDSSGHAAEDAGTETARDSALAPDAGRPSADTSQDAAALHEDAGDTEDAGPDACIVLDAGCADDASADQEPCIDYQSLREELLSAIAEAECAPGACPMVDVVARGAEARAGSIGKRILLIDEGVVVSAATRYRQRTLAYVAKNEQGVYEEVLPSFSVSRDALAILHRLDAEAPNAKAAELEIDDAFFAKFAQGGLPASLWGHGTDFLPFLAEYVPDSQFVVSDTTMSRLPDCDLLLEGAAAEPAWSTLSSFVDNLAASLSTIIERYDIHALHLSWGLDHANLAAGFEVQCNATASRAVTTRIMRLYANLFRALTALETLGADGRYQGVVIFQAGEWAEDGVPPDDTLDCTDVPRRVRSYSVPYDGYAVPPEGSYDQTLLPQGPAGHHLDCHDVFMVMGYRDTFLPPRPEAYFAFRPLGLGTHAPAWPPASSFSTPIALAHYFLGQANAPDADTDAWIDRVTRGGSQPILDPLLHDAFPPGGPEACP